jgi:moderate conductance mechanosensitive channel
VGHAHRPVRLPAYRRLLLRFALVVLVSLTVPTNHALAADPAATTTPKPDWTEHVINSVKTEVASDIAAAPTVSAAVDREWRELDRNGSAEGTLVDLGWVVAFAVVAVVAERMVVWELGRWRRRRLRQRAGAPTGTDMAAFLLFDFIGLVVFIALFSAARSYFMPPLTITDALSLLAMNVLVRWRIAAMILRVVLRPDTPPIRLIDITDSEARRLERFLTWVILAVISLIAFARLSLMDEDNVASHLVGLLVGSIVCALYVSIVIRARLAGEALIRGHAEGTIGAIRTGLAHAWLPVGLLLVAGLFVIFVAGLSLGLLAYYRAVNSTLGILFLVLVLDCLAERVWYPDKATDFSEAVIGHSLGARMVHRTARTVVTFVAALMLAWIWIGAVEPAEAAEVSAKKTAISAIGTLFIAYVVWEPIRLAIDHNLQAGGPSGAPGTSDDDAEAAPASRLQTVLPLLRGATAVLIGIIAVLIVLSGMGVNTAPLIAGAGVFGLAVSFGSQALVRDIISGLFYMWDDAFRVGEYIDTGRLKGTVEMLGIRSVRLRHQNGPLHTIPYGQLGAVTNLSRDFATIKFNLRFDPRTDIELVRKTAKQIGLVMQDENPEMATEVMQPLKLQGIAEVVDNAVVLRFKFTARPIKPSWVQREYLKRMYRVFDEKGIAFASGTVMLQTAPAVDSTPSPSPAPPADVPAAAAAAALIVASST